MDYCILLFNSNQRTSGDINNYTITFPWHYYYSASLIKVLSVNIPYDATLAGKIIYVTSDIVGGIDNGYVPVNNTKITDSIIAVVPVISSDPLISYKANYTDQYLTANGTYFGRKYLVQTPTRTLKFSLIDTAGNLIPLNSDWIIILQCVFNN
jgi:hypothetical protein